MAWTAIIADEILQERCVSSRGRSIPRGLKSKMSGYPLRRARAPSQLVTYPIRLRLRPK